MAKRMLVCLVLVVLSLLSTGCHVDDITVDQVVEYTSKKAADGPECNLLWIKGNRKSDFSLYLQQLHACHPKEGDEAKHGEMLLGAIQECAEICRNGFVAESTGREACVDQCKGGVEIDIDYE